MLIVGLIGGIGSGKSTVSERFAQLGVTIADADVASRSITKPGTEVLEKIVNRYGNAILQPDGSLNRAGLRPIIFGDTKERRWLEKLTHGPINAELRRVLESASSDYAILVHSARSGRSPLMDRVLVVDILPEMQMKRVIARDNNSREQVQSIMDAQLSREERLAIADDVLVNNGNLEQLMFEVGKLHHQYLSLSMIPLQENNQVNTQ